MLFQLLFLQDNSFQLVSPDMLLIDYSRQNRLTCIQLGMVHYDVPQLSLYLDCIYNHLHMFVQQELLKFHLVDISIHLYILIMLSFQQLNMYRMDTL